MHTKCTQPIKPNGKLNILSVQKDILILHMAIYCNWRVEIEFEFDEDLPFLVWWLFFYFFEYKIYSNRKKYLGATETKPSTFLNSTRWN